MPHGLRLLVVDEISDTEDVLRAVFEPRGLHVDRLRANFGKAPAMDSTRPAVVVIDEEFTPPSRTQNDEWRTVPQVIIGSARVTPSDPLPDDAQRHYLCKPFQYAELIQAIERLIKPRAA